MNNFTKIVTGWVKQYYERNESGCFVCSSQEFMAGDLIEYEDDYQEPIDPPSRKDQSYQAYEMVQPNDNG